MLAISIRQPWAWAIFHGKPIENRTWALPAEVIGKRTLVHAGKTLDPEDYSSAARLIAEPPLMIGWRVTNQWAWLHACPVELLDPIECRGQRGFWTVDEETARAIRGRPGTIREDCIVGETIEATIQMVAPCNRPR